MAIVSKGSGGSIKFSGTGGGIRVQSSTGGGGGGGGGGGSPPMTMLGAWFRADDAGSSNGAAVNSWADRSTSGDVLTVPGGFAAPLQPPTYLSSVAAFNNQPAVSFVSSGPSGYAYGSYLAMTSPAAYLAGDSALTIYAVISIDNYVGDVKRIFTYGTLGTYQQHSMISLFLADQWGTKRLGLETGYASNLYDYSIDSTARIVELRISQGGTVGSAFQAVNGATQTATGWPALNNGNAVPAIPSPVDKVTMGNGSFDGKIAEIIYYKKEHSSEERAATLSYLSSRYGISV